MLKNLKEIEELRSGLSREYNHLYYRVKVKASKPEGSLVALDDEKQR
jgi:hypothetical protein